VRQVVNDDGDVILARDYAPFGSMSSESGTGSSGYGFTGEQLAGYTQFIFLRARWMDPASGRFASQDPRTGSIYHPQSLSKYAYALNNPTNHVDPSGELPPWIERILAALRGLSAVDAPRSPTTVPTPKPYGTPGSYAAATLRPRVSPARVPTPRVVATPAPIAVWPCSSFVLSRRQLELAQEVASEFGIPPALLTSMLNVERVYDTEWYDTWIQNPYQRTVVFFAQTGGYQWPMAAKEFRSNAELQMRIWEVFWKPGAPGVGPGLGLGHVHTGPARRSEAYFNQRGLSDLLPAATSSLQLWDTLLSEEGNIRYVAAEARRLSELRIGGYWEYGSAVPIQNLSSTDVQVIMEGYWLGVDSFGTSGYTRREFQAATHPKSEKGALILPSWAHYQMYYGR